MLHIGNHLQALDPYIKTRPDYFVLDYLREINLITPEDYNDAIGYTERPPCDGLVPYNFETTRMKLNKDRSRQEQHDLEKERRQIRKERGKGKAAHIKSHKIRNGVLIRDER
jgi:hypothetical protein